MGKTVIPQLHRLLDSKNDLLRSEAAKIVEPISDRRSIPFLIRLLDDKEFEIRWIAAEGLIKIGRRSILPLHRTSAKRVSISCHSLLLPDLEPVVVLHFSCRIK